MAEEGSLKVLKGFLLFIYNYKVHLETTLMDLIMKSDVVRLKLPDANSRLPDSNSRPLQVIKEM